MSSTTRGLEYNVIMYLETLDEEINYLDWPI